MGNVRCLLSVGVSRPDAVLKASSSLFEIFIEVFYEAANAKKNETVAPFLDYKCNRPPQRSTRINYSWTHTLSSKDLTSSEGNPFGATRPRFLSLTPHAYSNTTICYYSPSIGVSCISLGLPAFTVVVAAWGFTEGDLITASSACTSGHINALST